MPPLGPAAPAADATVVDAGAPAAPKSFSDVKSAAMARAPAATPAAAAPVVPPDPAKPTGTPAEIDMTPEQLAAATASSKAEREARDKIKALEPLAAKQTQAAALIAEGKHAQAAELLGLDLNAAVAELLGTAPGAGEPVDPKLKELADRVTKLTETEAERAKRDAAELQARTAAARTADVRLIADHVKANAAEYPFLSRDEAWVAEAYDGASDAYPLAKEKLGRELTGEEKTKLIKAALAEKEAEHADKAKKYGAPSPVALERPGGAVPHRPSARPTTFDASMRGGTAAAKTTQPTKAKFSDVKRARRAAPAR